MRMETNLPGLTPETIEAVERALGSRLPNGLREAWLHDNKFEVGEWFFYPIKDERFLRKRGTTSYVRTGKNVSCQKALSRSRRTGVGTNSAF